MSLLRVWPLADARRQQFPHVSRFRSKRSEMACRLKTPSDDKTCAISTALAIIRPSPCRVQNLMTFLFRGTKSTSLRPFLPIFPSPTFRL
jgi:hypothetical protein